MNCARSCCNSCCRGNHQGALEMAQLDPLHLQDLLSPHLGGQWQGSPTAHSLLPHAGSARPHADRPRRATHLVSTLHAGLTRLMTGNPEPQPDLAHHWQIGEHGLRWRFFLRSQLRWQR